MRKYLILFLLFTSALFAQNKVVVTTSTPGVNKDSHIIVFSNISLTVPGTITVSNQFNITTAATQNNQGVRYQEFTNAIAGIVGGGGGDVFTTSNNTFVVGKTNIFNGEVFTSNLTVRGILNASNANFSGGVVFNGATDFNSNTLFNGRATFTNSTLFYGPVTFTNTVTFTNQANMTVAATVNNQLVRYQEFTNFTSTAGDVFTTSNNTFVAGKTNTFNGHALTSNLVVRGNLVVSNSSSHFGATTNFGNFISTNNILLYGPTTFTNTVTFTNQVNMTVAATANNQLVRYQEFTNGLVTGAGDVFTRSNNTFIVTKTNTFNGEVATSNLVVNGTTYLKSSAIIDGTLVVSNVVNFRVSGTGWGYDGTRFLMGTNDGSGNFDYEVRLDSVPTNPNYIRSGNFRNSGSIFSMESAGGVQVVIDNNNNDTDRSFIIRKDSTNGASLFTMQENGAATNFGPFTVVDTLTYSNKVGTGNYSYVTNVPALNQLITNGANRTFVAATISMSTSTGSNLRVDFLSFNQAGADTNTHGSAEYVSALTTIPTIIRQQVVGFINPNYIYCFTNTSTSPVAISTNQIFFRNYIRHTE